MNLSYSRWRALFLFGLGLSIGAAFCMKWMEADFWSNNEKFTILGLELFYPLQKVEGILCSLDKGGQTILRYQLYFDFAFMAGVYPGIAALCMMGRERTGATLSGKVLYLLAALQLVAWAADIIENIYLLQWIKEPVIGNEFQWYHIVVTLKWTIALTGIFLSVLFVLRKKRKYL